MEGLFNMKYFLALFMVVGIFLSGCNQFSSGDSNNKQKNSVELTYKQKQEIIVRFVNEQSKKISDLEVAAFDSLSSVSGENYTDDETLYKELINTTIPTYEKAVNEAKKVEPEIKELQKTAEIMVLATETFYEALILEKEALEKQDKKLIQQSNLQMKEYQSLIEKYHQELNEISKKYNVEYKPTNYK